MNNEEDQQLLIISELIKEAYKKDAKKEPLLSVFGDKINYLMLDYWCRDEEDKISLLKIIFKLTEMFPERVNDITDLLLCRTSLIEERSQEVSILYCMLYDLSTQSLH